MALVRWNICWCMKSWSWKKSCLHHCLCPIWYTDSAGFPVDIVRNRNSLTYLLTSTNSTNQVKKTTSPPCTALFHWTWSFFMLHNVMLRNVFYAIIVSKIAYAISSWYSFLTKAQIAQVNSLFKRAYKYGYAKLIITAEELSASYDDHLFHKASYDNHCLHHLLPSLLISLRFTRCWSWLVIRSYYHRAS